MGETTQIASSAPIGAGRPQFVRRAFAVIVGGVFIYAGGAKLFDPLRFASDISNYNILPWSVAVRLAFYLPWLEVLCGFALIFQRLFNGAVLITGALMLIFLGASVSAKARGINISCGCFGSASGSLSFAWHLALDLVLLAVLVALWFWPKRASR